MTSFDAIRPGMTATLEHRIDEQLVTMHVGGPGVLTTPGMIGLMERCCSSSVHPLLPPEFTTVGFEVCVRHLASADRGTSVRISSRLIEVDGRKLLFEVECVQESKICGKGTHRRTIVPRRAAPTRVVPSQ